MKPRQFELPQSAAVFNLAGERAPDPWRLSREQRERAAAQEQARAYQAKMQRSLAECPGFTAADAPSCPSGRGRVVVSPAHATEAAKWLKRRFAVRPALELDNIAEGLVFEIAARARPVPAGSGKRKRSSVFGLAEQFELALS